MSLGLFGRRSLAKKETYWVLEHLQILSIFAHVFVPRDLYIKHSPVHVRERRFCCVLKKLELGCKKWGAHMKRCGAEMCCASTRCREAGLPLVGLFILYCPGKPVGILLQPVRAPCRATKLLAGWTLQELLAPWAYWRSCHTSDPPR